MTAQAKIIDSHQHFWQLGRFNTTWLDAPGLAAIRRDYLPEHLKPLIDQVGVERTVVVQTQHDPEETWWMLALAEDFEWIAGVVGWVDLASLECESQLAHFQTHPKFVGVRHIVQDEPDDDFIVQPQVVAGLKVLEQHRTPFDLLFHVRHLRHAATLGRMLPELPLVIDHLAKPRIRERSFDDWEPHVREAARHENIYCKLSGMITEADWRCWAPADFTPYLDVALEAFGPQRLMFGSDWPVCELAGEYAQVFETLQQWLSSLSESERARILGGTARAFYGLAS